MNCPGRSRDGGRAGGQGRWERWAGVGGRGAVGESRGHKRRRGQGTWGKGKPGEGWRLGTEGGWCGEGDHDHHDHRGQGEGWHVEGWDGAGAWAVWAGPR
jgi:hypothetical protein